MARIYMKSTDMRRSFRDVLDAITRGDEIVVEHYNRTVALISPYREDRPGKPDATATTEYGDWHLMVADGSDTPEDQIAQCGITAAEYDVAAVMAEYRQAIASVLPEGVTLAGEMVYGPYGGQDDYREELPGIRQRVADIDLLEIARRHEYDNKAANTP